MARRLSKREEEAAKKRSLSIKPLHRIQAHAFETHNDTPGVPREDALAACES